MKNSKHPHTDSPDRPAPKGEAPPALEALLQSYRAEPFSHEFADRVMLAVHSSAAPSSPAAAHPFMTVIHALKSPAVLRVAATIALLLAVGFGFWQRTYTYEAALGAQSTRLLPDGSTVQLGSGSRIAYQPFWGRAERTVVLEGEAFFAVESSEKPFVVETFNAEVRVLGTQFNVKAWPNARHQYTAVTLQEGEVAVSPRRKPGRSVTLLPSESVMLHADSTRPTPYPVSMDAMLYWKDGGYAFQNESLATVAAELERRHNVAIHVPAELQALRTTHFAPRPAPLEDVLEAIIAPHPSISFRPTANGYELFRDESNRLLP